MAVQQTFQNYFYNAKKLYEFRIKLALCYLHISFWLQMPSCSTQPVT